MTSGATVTLPAPARPLPAVRRRHLAWCVAAVALAHGALLTVTQPAGGATTQARPTTVTVRLLSTDTAAPRHGALAAADRAAMGGRLAEASTSSTAPDALAGAKLEPVSSPRVQGGLVGGDGDIVYLPRAALTVAPRARSPVNVAYPYFDGEADNYSGEFELFIDDTGGVVRVVSSNPELPGILVKAVREAFLSAAFTPGEREGRAVRSRIRIEVTFDQRALPPS
jgi:hypothetical protein